jgi:arginase family enzyme
MHPASTLRLATGCSTELIDALARIGGDPRLLAAEVVEYNPFRNPDGRTACTIENALVAMLLGAPPTRAP